MKGFVYTEIQMETLCKGSGKTPHGGRFSRVKYMGAVH